MKKQFFKDKSSRKLQKAYEKKRFLFKIVMKNSTFGLLTRWKSFYEFSKLPLKSSHINRNNKCILSGRRKRVNKLYNFSRMKFLSLVKSNQIVGVTKSVW